MNKIIAFKIARGKNGYYISSCEDSSIFTHGKTFENMTANIKDATKVSLEDIYQGKAKSFPPIMMNMDYSDVAYT